LKNRIVIRVKKDNSLVLASYLRYLLDAYYHKGYWKIYQHGSVFDSLRLEYVKDFLKKLGLQEVTKVFILSEKTKLDPNDILIHRLGYCGKIDYSNYFTGGDYLEYGFR